jgi:hypothetical protein
MPHHEPHEGEQDQRQDCIGELGQHKGAFVARLT